jgi:hypothetical protein
LSGPCARRPSDVSAARAADTGLEPSGGIAELHPANNDSASAQALNATLLV